MRIELIKKIDGKQVTGLSEMKQLADAGNVKALNLLGEWMMMGFECSPDPEFCCACFRKAAIKGNTQAMLNLGDCHLGGYGVEADYYAAERWIQAALEGGDTEALNLFYSLYLTTIGEHKPDKESLYKYVEILKKYDPSCSTLGGSNIGFFDKLILTDDEIKVRIMENLVLSYRGKNVKEIKKLKGKVTDADIEGFLRLHNAQFDDAPSRKQKDKKAEKAKIVSNIESVISTATRSELSEIWKVIGYLDKEVYQAVKDLSLIDEKAQKGKAANHFQAIMRLQYRASTVEEATNIPSYLSWQLRAIYDVDTSAKATFDAETIETLITKVSVRLDEIENAEISAKYSSADESWNDLLQLKAEISEYRHYSSAVVKAWTERIDARVEELQEAECSKKHANLKTDYFAHEALYVYIAGNITSETVKEKWLNVLSSSIIELQEAACKNLCANTDDMPFAQLEATLAQVKKYSFDAKTLAAYTAQLDELIEKAQNKEVEVALDKAGTNYDRVLDVYDALGPRSQYSPTVRANWKVKVESILKELQVKELNKLIEDIDSLPYSELISRFNQAQHFMFDEHILTTAISPLNDLIDKHEKNHLEELCSDLEAMSVEQLTSLLQKIDKLKYREKNAEAFYGRITPVLERKELLARCTLYSLSKMDATDLDQLIRDVHFSDIPGKKKEEIFDAINAQKEVFEKAMAEKSEDVLYSDLLKSIKDKFTGLGLYGTHTYSDNGKKITLEVFVANDPAFEACLAKEKATKVKKSPLPALQNEDVLFILVEKDVEDYGSVLVITKNKICNELWAKSFDELEDIVPTSNSSGVQQFRMKFSQGYSSTYSLYNAPQSKVKSVIKAIEYTISLACNPQEFYKKRIAAIDERYGAVRLASGAATGNGYFKQFIETYSPEAVGELSMKQIDETIASIAKSPCEPLERDILTYIFRQIAKLEQMALQDKADCENAFQNSVCKKLEDDAGKYLSSSIDYAINTGSLFSSKLSSIKSQYREYGVVDERQFKSANDNGIFVCKPGGKGALILLTKDSLFFGSGYDFTHDHYCREMKYSRIHHFSTYKKGFTNPPELWMYWSSSRDDYHWINLPQCSETAAKGLSEFLNSFVTFMNDSSRETKKENEIKSIGSSYAKIKGSLFIASQSAISKQLDDGNGINEVFFEKLKELLDEQANSYHKKQSTTPATSDSRQANKKRSDTNTQKAPSTSAPATQIAVSDVEQLKQMASRLGISDILDFENVDIQTFLNNNPGYEKSGQKVVKGEHGVVLVKNEPEPILLTNTSYYSATSHFGKSYLYHSHPSITSIPFDKYSVVFSLVSKSRALKYNYFAEINGTTPRMEGEIPSKFDKDTLERVLQFLKYAAYGTQPTIKETSTPVASTSTPATTTNKPTQTSAQQSTGTQDNSIEALKEKGLSHLHRKVSELTDAELGEAILALALKHGTRGYLPIGTDGFNNKIGKAKAAYARIPVGERILMMYDNTIFGSAKEGFVVTDKHFYINISGCKNQCIPIADITSVHTSRGSGLTDLMVATSSGNYRFDFQSEIAQGDARKSFMYELIRYLNPNCEIDKVVPVANAPAPPVAPSQTTATAPQNKPMWQCGCGSVNADNFCSKCGGKKENGTPLWTCSCGNLNKGKFCSKCGTPRKE